MSGAPSPMRFLGAVVASGVWEAAVEGSDGWPRRPGGCGPHT